MHLGIQNEIALPKRHIKKKYVTAGDAKSIFISKASGKSLAYDFLSCQRPWPLSKRLRMQQLIQYLLVAMLSWIPVRNLTPYGETEDEVSTRYKSIATDVAVVALDSAEPPTFAGVDGRVKTALLQVAIASMETGFQKFVDDGDCNRPGYHADRRGDCDGGHAFSFWQIHVSGGGYVLLEDGTLTSRMYASKEVLQTHAIIGGLELVSDRKNAVRVAQRIERNSLRYFHSLCSYSGESCADGRHPKAEARYQRAVEYYKSHPYTGALPQVLSTSSSVMTSSAIAASVTSVAD